MMLNLLTLSVVKLFALDMTIQLAGWIIAVLFKTEKFYDLTGSITFILLSYLSHEWSRKSARQFIQSHMVMAWAGRLGMYLFLRILKDGKDSRFDQAKENPMKFLVFWMIQGLWVFVTLLPTLLLNNSTRDTPIGVRDYFGWAMWIIGMFFEVLADFQKSMFKMNPQNKDKFISSGLWAISRHPNYFGEILLWFGLYLSASSVFQGAQFLSVLSPIFVYLLITRVSGIPLLERSAAKKWGTLPSYQQYILNTPVLIPFTKWY